MKLFDYYLAENLENLFEQEEIKKEDEIGPAEEKAREQTLENPITGRDNKVGSIVDNPKLDDTPVQQKAEDIIDQAKEKDASEEKTTEEKPGGDDETSTEEKTESKPEDEQEIESKTEDEQTKKQKRLEKAKRADAALKIVGSKESPGFLKKEGIKPALLNDLKDKIKDPNTNHYDIYRTALAVDPKMSDEEKESLKNILSNIFAKPGEELDFTKPPKKEEETSVKPEDVNIPKIEPTDEQKKAIENAKNIMPPSFKTKEDRDKFIDALSKAWDESEAFKDIPKEKKDKIFENLKECKNPEETYDLIMKENPNADFSQTVALLNLFYNKGVDQDEETKQQLDKLKEDNPDYEAYENKVEEHLGTESSALHTAGALTILAGLALGVFFGPLVAVAGIVAGGAMLFAGGDEAPKKDWYSNVSQHINKNVIEEPEKKTETKPEEKSEKPKEEKTTEEKPKEEEKTTEEKAKDVLAGKSVVKRHHMETRGVPKDVDINKLTDEQIKQYGVKFYDDNGNEIDKNKYDQLDKESKDNEKSMIDAKVIEDEKDKPPTEPEKKHDAVLWLKDKYAKVKKLTGDESKKGKKWFKDVFNKLKSDWGHPHPEEVKTTEPEEKLPETPRSDEVPDYEAPKTETKPEEKPVENKEETKPEEKKEEPKTQEKKTKKTSSKTKKTTKKPSSKTKKPATKTGKSKPKAKNESVEDLMSQFIKLHENEIKDAIKKIIK